MTGATMLVVWPTVRMALCGSGRRVTLGYHGYLTKILRDQGGYHGNEGTKQSVLQGFLLGIPLHETSGDTMGIIWNNLTNRGDIIHQSVLSNYPLVIKGGLLENPPFRVR